MMLNLESKTSYYQFDDWRMLIVPGDELSWRDSIGRTVLAWIAYRKPRELFRALYWCIDQDSFKNYPAIFKLKRHPFYNESASRDHWSYWIISRKLGYKYPAQFLELIKCIPRMRGMNYWIKAISGNKTAEFLYYLIYIPGARIGNAWNKLIRWIGRGKLERDNKWWIAKYGNLTHGLHLQRSLTKWQRFWLRGPRFKLFGKEYHIEILIPAYSLHVKAWQIYVMPKSKNKDKLKRILLQRVGKSNIMLRLLLGDTVTQEEVDNYPHMTGYRPGVYLYETLRTIREMDVVESEFNTYEKDLIIWLYETQSIKRKYV